MNFISKEATGEKAREKLNACREQGLKIVDNFLSGVTTVYDGNAIVLEARRLAGAWKLSFNPDYWEERDVVENMAGMPQGERT